MNDSTFIKLYRKLTEWEWYSDSNTKAVFLHLLLTANHKTIKKKGVTYKRGTAVFGREEMAKILGLSVRNVRTSINHLKVTNEVTIKTTPKGSIATIINYDKYQQCDQQSDQRVTNRRPTGDQQVTTNKNDKNDKNDKNYIYYGEYQNVRMESGEYEKLIAEYKKNVVDTKIQYLDDKIESKEKKYCGYKNHYLTLRCWLRGEDNNKLPPQDPRAPYGRDPDTNIPYACPRGG